MEILELKNTTEVKGLFMSLDATKEESVKWKNRSVTNKIEKRGDGKYKKKYKIHKENSGKVWCVYNWSTRSRGKSMSILAKNSPK